MTTRAPALLNQSSTEEVLGKRTSIFEEKHCHASVRHAPHSDLVVFADKEEEEDVTGAS